MRRSLKRGLRVGVLGAAVAGLLLAASPSAFAAPNPQDPIPGTMLDTDNSGTINAGDIVVAMAGSDTTYDVMRDVINSMSTNVKNHTFNVPPLLTPAPAAMAVPGDASCASVTYDPAETDASYLVDTDADFRLINPNGSGQGRSALNFSAAGGSTFGSASIDTGGGCIDIARSSGFSANGAAPNSGMEFFAFALDAVGWGTSSLKAPTTMTVAQLKAVYKCAAASENDVTLGLTTAQKAVDADDRINNWAEVGGAPGRISRVLPQVGSGTRDFFLANVLGNASVSIVAPDGQAPFCDDVLLPQENDGSLLISGNGGANVGRYDEYILPYSAGKWDFQVKRSDNKTQDVRGGVRMGALTRVDGVSTCPTTPLTFEDSSYQAAFPIRFNGSDYVLNSGTTMCFNYIAGTTGTPASITPQDPTPGTPISKTNGVTATGLGDTTLDSGSAGNFTSAWLGLQLSGPCIADGTTITGVDGPGQVLTISPSAKCAITPSTVLTAGISPVNEYNDNILSASNQGIFPGVRFLYNVVNTNSPNYDQAVNMVGFTSAGNSPICNSTNEGEIADNGFQPLPKTTNSLTLSSTGTSCRKRT